jgi:hypothetical protein
MPVEQLNRAIALIKSGQKDSARVILTQLVRAHPDNDVAWLWLVESITDENKRLSVLEAGLKINPQSAMLQRGLNRLRQLQESDIKPTVTPGSDETPEANESNVIRQASIGKAILPKRERFLERKTPAEINIPPEGDTITPEQAEILDEIVGKPLPDSAETYKPAGKHRRFTLTQDFFLLVLGLVAVGIAGFAVYIMQDQLGAWLGLKKAVPTLNSRLLTPDSANLTAQAALTHAVPTLTPTHTPTVTPLPTPTSTVGFSFSYPVISPANASLIVQVGELSSIPARSVAFSSDNRMLAAGMNDSSIYVWNLSTGDIIVIFTGHTQPVNAVAFSPDGKYLVSGSEDSTVRVWDIVSLDEFHILTGHVGPVKSVAFSPDGHTFASGSSDGGLFLWQMGSETASVKLAADGPVDNLDFSRDGRLLATGLDTGVVKIWEVASVSLLKTMPGHNGAVNCVRFSPSGHLLVTGSADKTVKLWDVDKGRILYTIGTHTDPVMSVSFSPDGQVVASASQGQTIKIWDVAQHREIILLRHPRDMPAITFSPDGRVLASALLPTNPASTEGGVALWGVLQESEAVPTLVPLTIDTLKKEMWSPGARMAIPHAAHQSVLITGGRVLIISGGAGTDPASYTPKVELYDPVSGTSLLTGGVDSGRGSFSATSLEDDRALVVGGYNPTDQWVAGAEIYDPIGGVWTMSQPLYNHGIGHTATELDDGRVLVTGGCIGDGITGRSNQTELFNPATNSWTDAGALSSSRCGHIAVLLTDGRVLVAGGENGNGDLRSAELYDPVTGQWSPTGDLNVARRNAVAVGLMDGRVMVTGGEADVNGSLVTQDSVEMYDATLGIWQQAAPMLELRYGHTMTVLPGGLVLVVGGVEDKGAQPRRFIASVDIYNPQDDTWIPVASTKVARGFHTSTLLPDGRIFVAGGMSAEGEILASTEILIVSRPPKQDIPTPIIWSSRTPTLIPEFGITSTLTGTIPIESTPTPGLSSLKTSTPKTNPGGLSFISLPPCVNVDATAYIRDEIWFIVYPKLIPQRG